MVKETVKRAATTIRCKAVLKHISYDEIDKLERPLVKNDKLSKEDKTDHLLRCKTAKTRNRIDVMAKPSKNQEKPVSFKSVWCRGPGSRMTVSLVYSGVT